MRYDGLRSSMANGPGSLCCFGSWKPSVSRPLPEIIGLGSDCCRVSFSSRIWWYGLASWNKARGNRHKEVINDVRLFLEWILGHALQSRFDVPDNNRKLLQWSAGIRLPSLVLTWNLFRRSWASMFETSGLRGCIDWVSGLIGGGSGVLKVDFTTRNELPSSVCFEKSRTLIKLFGRLLTPCRWLQFRFWGWGRRLSHQNHSFPC